MSKYKKDELGAGTKMQDSDMSSEHFEDPRDADIDNQTINQMLNINLEQNAQIIAETEKIMEVKTNV